MWASPRVCTNSPRLQVAHLGDHHGEDRVGGNVKRHSKENIRTALVQLAGEFSVCDIKLEKGMAQNMVGKTGTAMSVLRPSGKVIIDNQIYDAKSEDGFIDKEAEVEVIKFETGQVYVIKTETNE